MKDLDNWFETIDQLAISIATILELVCSVLKEFEDRIGSSAVLELLGKRVFGKVYPSLLEVVLQGSIENVLKIGRGKHCRGHGTERGVGCIGRRESWENVGNRVSKGEARKVSTAATAYLNAPQKGSYSGHIIPGCNEHIIDASQGYTTSFKSSVYWRAADSR